MADIGRPTEYTEELGDKILSLMEAGLSLAAAAADCNVHRQRIYDWANKHPNFADTINLARAKRQLFLERRLLSAEIGPIVTSSIFALKNAAPDDWRDKQEVEHSGTVVTANPFETLEPDERDAIRAILARRIEESKEGSD